MEAKHTPGPWKAIVDPEGWELVASGRGQTIATFDCSESDAHLIAAAPDLLAVVQEAIDFVWDELRENPDKEDMDGSIMDRLIELQTALISAKRKAKGT